MVHKLTIRVYGLIVHNSKLLVSKEVYKGKDILKFPGGGLEFGESVIDCLHREIKEELNANVTSHKLLYVSEDFVQSMFFPEEQVTLIYYLIETDTYDFHGTEHTVEWVDLKDDHQFTFKQEQDAFEKLKVNF